MGKQERKVREYDKRFKGKIFGQICNFFQHISWLGGVVRTVANYPFARNWNPIALTHLPDAKDLIKSPEYGNLKGRWKEKEFQFGY